MIHLAGVIITDARDRILLLHRSVASRIQWEIPGGKIEDGETASVAAIREIREELATDVEIIRELGSAKFHEDNFTMLYSWFLGKVVGTPPQIGEPDRYDDLRFWLISDLRKTVETISPNTRNFIDRFNSDEVKLA